MRLYHFIFCLLLLLGAAGAAQAQVGIDTPRIPRGQTTEQLSRRAAGPSRKVIGPPIAQAKKDSLIKNIRAVFQRINSDTALRIEDLDAEEFEEAVGGMPDNGFDVRGYFKKDTLYKLYLSVGPSFGLKDYEYYYDRGEIVFIYEKDRHYPPKADGEGLDHEKLVVGFEGRFYFNKGKLISKVVKRYDDFMAQEIDEAYIRELLDVDPYVGQLRKHLTQKK